MHKRMDASDDLVQRRAATVAFAYLKPDPLPDLARAAILDAIAAADLENSFDGLPWDVVARGHGPRETPCVPRCRVPRRGGHSAIVAVESGNATHQTVSTVLSLVFPGGPPCEKPPLTGFSAAAARRSRRGIRDGG